jgi:hypothetical protein
LGDQFGWTSAVLAYACGLGFGSAAASVTAYFAITQLDLRKNGIVMHAVAYWPWSQVKVVRWRPERVGRLVFGRGWRRISATIRPEQRKAIEAVLREKLDELRQP